MVALFPRNPMVSVTAGTISTKTKQCNLGTKSLEKTSLTVLLWLHCATDHHVTAFPLAAYS